MSSLALPSEKAERGGAKLEAHETAGVMKKERSYQQANDGEKRERRKPSRRGTVRGRQPSAEDGLETQSKGAVGRRMTARW